MLDKLQKIAERLAEVERQLADPAVYSDRQAMTKLSREQKELTPVVEAYRAYSRPRPILPPPRTCCPTPSCGSWDRRS